MKINNASVLGVPWVNGHIQVNHPREPWKSDPDILVQATLNRLKGKKGTAERAEYTSAKRSFDMGAAFNVVERCVSQSAMDSIIAHVIGGGMNARIVVPHPAFDDDDGGAIAVSNTDKPTNALPFAYASFLKSQTGCEVDGEIVQVARVGRTKLNKFERFIYQPSFGGAVRTDQPYILLDDVVTTAGTLAALRSYIVRNGGKVIFSTVLANREGKNQPLPLTLATKNVLSGGLGRGLEPFWHETVGHDVDCLTEFEGRVLGGWCDEQRQEGIGAGDELLQRLRDRIDEAASTCG